MKKLLSFLFVVGLSILPLFCNSEQHVKGHYRKNGTYVNSYVRGGNSAKPKTSSGRHVQSRGSYSPSYSSESSHSSRGTIAGSVGFRPEPGVKVKCDPRQRFFPKEMRLKKYEEQMGICPHCKMRYKFEEMEGDHIVPWSKGGETTWENLQMLCKYCNRKKGNRYSY